MREALAYAFDFEWSNKNLFYGAYQRTRSYFDNSELAATGVPQDEELKILERFAARSPTRSSRPSTTRRNTTVRAIFATACGRH